MTQAKCSTCKVRWTWTPAIPRRLGLRCPCCGGAISQTSGLLQWPAILTTKQAMRGRASWNPFCNGSCKREFTTQEAFRKSGL